MNVSRKTSLAGSQLLIVGNVRTSQSTVENGKLIFNANFESGL